MAEEGRRRSLFELARDGFNLLTENLGGLIRRNNLRGFVRELRSIPISDREKKRELAAFFQTDVGERYSRDEKREAYNQLLGERADRQRG